VSDCIQNRSLGINSIQDLVRSPLVSISSVPPMTRDQYLTLFANQYANLSLQEPNDQSLVKAGLPQVGATIIPWVQNGIFDANMQFISWGNQIGLDTLQVYPSLSTQYRLDKSQVIRLDYDYDLNQARIRYQRHF
jgi:translocation and assembly module TamB